MVYSREQEITLELIRLYKELPALWNVDDKAYYASGVKNRAYNVLLEKYRELDPDAKLADLKRKINNLRTNYNRESRKITKSKKNGEPREPRLWYFKEFDFLRAMRGLRKSKETEDSESVDNTALLYSSDGSDVESFHFKVQESGEDVNSDQDQNVTAWNVNEDAPNYIEIAANKKRRIVRDPIMEENLAPSFEDETHKKDEFFYWAISCAADLRKMDHAQQVYAKKAIADVLMEGQLGMLHRNSVKVNESTQEQCTSSQNSSLFHHLSEKLH